ncbi:MAG: hypothetical protein ACP5GX_08740, partial [Anaerolineae bacterium]
SDVMYPGWVALVDGVEQPIRTTNLIMRGVYLERGAHEVVFEFRPLAFYLGSGITTAALMAVIAGVVFDSRRRATK